LTLGKKMIDAGRYFCQFYSVIGPFVMRWRALCPL